MLVREVLAAAHAELAAANADIDSALRELSGEFILKSVETGVPIRLGRPRRQRVSRKRVSTE